MAWMFPAAVLVLLTCIAAAAWEGVRVLRHLSAQQAATVQLLMRLDGKVAQPADYGAATWKALERAETRHAISVEKAWWRPAESPLP